jgi:hypothetical protein
MTADYATTLAAVEAAVEAWDPTTGTIALTNAIWAAVGSEGLRARVEDVDTRCREAGAWLTRLADAADPLSLERARLSGKREGVALVRDYLRAALAADPGAGEAS